MIYITDGYCKTDSSHKSMSIMLYSTNDYKITKIFHNKVLLHYE